jgi:uncharacterized repeat protein (TIGR01451 family)/CSLREA domain-containing protein
VCAGIAQASVSRFPVTTTADSDGSDPCTPTLNGIGPPVDPTCTLRDAVAAANATAEGSSFVEVPPGRYVLTNGQLSVTQAITIVGVNGGARVTTISGNHASRVLSIANPSSNYGVELLGLTIADGETTQPGGGILVTGAHPVHIADSAIVDNHTTDRGAGIFRGVGGNLSVNRSLIARNSASFGGGGLFVEGTDAGHSRVDVFSSTFAHNSASAGSAVYVGRGTAADSNTAYLTKATIARNTSTSPGGAMLDGGTASNRQPGTFNLLSSIVAEPGSGTTTCGSGTFWDDNDNLESSDAGLCGFAGEVGSQTGVDPKLGPLEDNGGPTDTMALANGSPAIDASRGPSDEDQRSLTASNPQGHEPGIDVGAYEAPQDANLAISATDSPDPVAAGDTVTYTLTVASTGPMLDAAQPRVQDTIPAGTQLVSAVPSQGTCTGAVTVNCALGRLANGATATVAVTVRPSAPGSISNTATVSSPRFDANGDDNSLTLDTTVEPAVVRSTPGDGGNDLPGGGAGSDITAPGLTTLALAPATFSAAGSGPSAAAATGTTVRYSLSEAATVTFRVTTKKPGRKAGKRCVRPTRKNAAKRKCKRTVTLPGSFKHAGKAGLNSFRFTGRIGGRKLKPGKYRLVGVAKDAAGNKSKAVSAAFRIVR